MRLRQQGASGDAVVVHEPCPPVAAGRAPRDARGGGRIALVSGGGSGHEPPHAGFVGHGMLGGGPDANSPEARSPHTPAWS
ncbi:dihydroxyacetone kinase subunit DhaK [Streptomyces sp. NBC_00868]|nr:dihydroxyacetone kinase subunit DhaK [Streptomyces sp. NBC_00868]